MPGVITKDHLYEPGDDLPSRVGTQGPHDATEQLALAAEGRTWRVLDDDGMVYYEGCIWSAEPAVSWTSARWMTSADPTRAR